MASDGQLKSVAKLQRLFKGHNITPQETAITHCQSGGRASLEAFALELVGYPKVKVFYSGWLGWSADQEAPVEK